MSTLPPENLDKVRIAVIGLGYVGLPLAVEFGKQFPTLGFDVNAARVRAIREGIDETNEVTAEELRAAHLLQVDDDSKGLAECNVYVVTVPTPVTKARQPDLEPMRRASETVGFVLKTGDVVIYESTVYPGCTEEFCVPILEDKSGLICNRDFFVGYSPERINPGDPERKLPTIRKVTAGSTPESADFVDGLYQAIIPAGTHRASSIKVAEAAKVIENTQRDLNIALVNELAVLFGKLGIDTQEVLKAAATKWNFLPFQPGLVGGHCIGVDPYYLTHKAQEIGHHPEVILAGRRINDSMASHVADDVVRLMIRSGLTVRGSRVLVLGLTFKENCPDIRNTQVTTLIDHLSSYEVIVDVHDPWVDASTAEREYGLAVIDRPDESAYDAIVLTVAHRQFVELGSQEIRKFGKPNAILYDVKSIFPRQEVDGRL